MNLLHLEHLLSPLNPVHLLPLTHPHLANLEHPVHLYFPVHPLHLLHLLPPEYLLRRAVLENLLHPGHLFDLSEYPAYPEYLAHP